MDMYKTGGMKNLDHLASGMHHPLQWVAAAQVPPNKELKLGGSRLDGSRRSARLDLMQVQRLLRLHRRLRLSPRMRTELASQVHKVDDVVEAHADQPAVAAEAEAMTNFLSPVNPGTRTTTTTGGTTLEVAAEAAVAMVAGTPHGAGRPQQPSARPSARAT